MPVEHQFKRVMKVYLAGVTARTLWFDDANFLWFAILQKPDLKFSTQWSFRTRQCKRFEPDFFVRLVPVLIGDHVAIKIRAIVTVIVIVVVPIRHFVLFNVKYTSEIRELNGYESVTACEPF